MSVAGIPNETLVSPHLNGRFTCKWCPPAHLDRNPHSGRRAARERGDASGALGTAALISGLRSASLPSESGLQSA